MEKIPTPQKKISFKQEKKTYLLTISSKIYELTITKRKDKISFCFEQNDSLINAQYEDSYSIDFFKNKSRYFKLFENIDELYKNIIAIFDKQNYEIINDNNTINIKLIPMVLLDNSEINMMIPLKNIHSKELIQQLFDQNIAIGSRVNDLENEVKSLRSDFKNMSHIIENLKQSVKKFEENK
jgi:hypothetical protein